MNFSGFPWDPITLSARGRSTRIPCFGSDRVVGPAGVTLDSTELSTSHLVAVMPDGAGRVRAVDNPAVGGCSEADFLVQP